MKISDLLVERQVARKAETYARRLLLWFMESSPQDLIRNQIQNSLSKAVTTYNEDGMFDENQQIIFSVDSGVVTDEPFTLVFNIDTMGQGDAAAGFASEYRGYENIIFIMNFDPEIEDDEVIEEDFIDFMKDTLEFKWKMIYSSLVHEMTHYIDKQELEDPQGQSWQQYFNSYQEFRAYMVQSISSFEDDVEDKQQYLLQQDFDSFFQAFVQQYLHPEFAKRMEESTEKEVRNELFTAYQELRQEFGIE